MGTTCSTHERDEKYHTSWTKRPPRIPERGWEASIKPFQTQWVLYINLQPVVNYETHRASVCLVL